MTWKVDLYSGWWETKLIGMRAGPVAAAPLLHERGEFTVSMPVSVMLEQIRFTQRQDVKTMQIRDDNDVQLFSGVVAEPNGYLLSSTTDGESMSWSGHDVYWLASRRAAVPDPEKPIGPWDRDRHTETGRASTVAATFLSKHFGPLADVDRQGATIIDDDAGRIGTWSAAAGELLTDVIPRVAAADLAVTATVNSDGTPVFRCAARRDLTSSIVISEADLENVQRRLVPRSVTTVIGTRGEGTDRGVLADGIGATGLDRIERVVAVPADDEFRQTVTDALTAGGEQWSISGTLSARGALRLKFMSDYRLGDFLSVIIDDVRVPVPVTGVSLSWVDGRALATPIFGEASRDTLRRLLRRQDNIERELRRLTG